MKAQDGYARTRLAQLPGRGALAARLGEVFYVDSVGAPRHRGERYFFTRKHKDKEKGIVYWKAGERGAPPLERTDTVAGQKGLYAQKMWLMSHGSYTVAIDVFGKRGQHGVSVPVMALATTRLGLSAPFAALMIGFGILLFCGLVAIVRAAASDSLVDAEREPNQLDRRRGSLGAVITVPILLVLVFAGAKWWSGEDTSYDDTMYKPLTADATAVGVPRRD